jgi:hypothetical protein
MWLPCCHCRRRWCKGRGFVVLCLRGIGGVKDLSWTPWPFCWTFEDAVLGCCEIESRLSQLVERGSGCGIVGGSDRVYCGEWWLLSACDADQLIVEDKDFLLVAWEIWPVLKDDYFFFFSCKLKDRRDLLFLSRSVANDHPKDFHKPCSNRLFDCKKNKKFKVLISKLIHNNEEKNQKRKKNSGREVVIFI